MERYDNIVKSSEVRKLVEKRMYQQALEIMDTMDIDRIKVLTDLSVFAEVYIQTERYVDAKDILLRIKEKSNSRRVIYQLIRLAVKMKDAEAAEDYYDEYVEVAPKDSDKYILRYRIDKMKGEDIQVLIKSLEELKEHDYIEKWAYELAKLYHKAGMKDKCIRECSDIILWFGDGIIVEKAKVLKELYIASPKHIQAIKAEEKKAIEEEKGLLKTKDLSSITEKVNQVLTNALEKDELLKPQNEETNTEDEPEATEESEKAETEKETDKGDSFDDIQEALQQQLQNLEITEPEEQEKVTEQELTVESEKMEESEPVEEPEQLEEQDPYMNILGCYGKIHRLSDELCDSLKRRKQEQKPSNYIITGGKGCGKTTLAKRLAKVFYEMNIIGTSQVAVMPAEKLNEIDLKRKYRPLQNRTMIIQKASELSSQSWNNLIEVTKLLEGNVVFILEDEDITKIGLNDLQKGCFNEIIQIPEYSASDLAEFAIERFQKEEYELGDGVREPLVKFMENIVQNEFKETYLAKTFDVVHLIEEKADHRHMGELRQVVETRSYLETNLNSIIPEDF